MHVRLANWLLLALLFAASAHAQWAGTRELHASPDVFAGSTCSAQWQYLLIDDFALTGWQQADVYGVWQRVPLRPHQPPPPLNSWSITVYDMGSPPADLSVWVCQNKTRDIVSGCVDMDYGSATHPLHVTVPAVWGWYYIIVTTSLISASPTCGPYVLYAEQVAP